MRAPVADAPRFQQQRAASGHAAACKLPAAGGPLPVRGERPACMCAAGAAWRSGQVGSARARAHAPTAYEQYWYGILIYIYGNVWTLAAALLNCIVGT